MKKPLGSQSRISSLGRLAALLYIATCACTAGDLIIGEVPLPDADAATRKDAGAQQAPMSGPRVEQWLIDLPADEVARRLALFLFNAEPSLQFAQDVVMRNPRSNQDVGALTEALLRDEHSTVGVRNFYKWWLKLDRWEARPPNPKVYPALTPPVRQALLEDALTFAEKSTWQAPGTFANMMTEPSAYVTAATPEGWFPVALPLGRSVTPQRVELPSSIYAGLLTQPAVVSAPDNFEQRSITRRAITILESLLCGDVPPAPANVPVLRQPRDNETLRQWWEDVTSADRCIGCHHNLDPLGFVFEDFNGVGAVNFSNDQQLPNAAAFVGPPLFETPHLLGAAPGLANVLSDSSLALNCFAASWLAYGTGLYQSGAQALASADRSDIEYILSRATIDGELNLLAVIRAVTETRSFLRPKSLR